MPRKRRKAVASIVTPDIPYPKVRVEWIDCVSDSGWATEKEFDRMKLAKPVNEGWLYSKDKYSVKLFASYDKDDDGITFGDRTMIHISSSPPPFLPVFIIFLSMYSPAALPRLASAFTAEEKEPLRKAASLSLASSATCPS
jgi:hypothetical protein